MTTPRKTKQNVPALPSTRAYGYVRVSTFKQADKGLSLGDQEEKIRAYCTYKALTLERIFTDPAESAHAKNLYERPQGNKLLGALVAGDHVVITRLDRAWRNVRDALETVERWRDQNVTVHLLDVGIDTGSVVGKLFFTILAAFAEWEANMIRERTMAGKARSAAQGVWQKSPPFGTEIDPVTRGLRARWPHLFWAVGMYSLRGSSVPPLDRPDLLNRHGLRRPEGGLWTHFKQVAKTNDRLSLNYFSAVLPLFHSHGLSVSVDPGRITFRDRDGLEVDPATWRPL